MYFVMPHAMMESDPANEVADTSPPRPTWPSLGHYKDVPTI